MFTFYYGLQAIKEECLQLANPVSYNQNFVLYYNIISNLNVYATSVYSLKRNIVQYTM